MEEEQASNTTTRQLRPRGNNVATAAQGKRTTGQNRQVFGDVSNSRQGKSKSNGDKPTASRNPIAIVRSLRRSTRAAAPSAASTIDETEAPTQAEPTTKSRTGNQSTRPPKRASRSTLRTDPEEEQRKPQASAKPAAAAKKQAHGKKREQSAAEERPTKKSRTSAALSDSNERKQKPRSKSKSRKRPSKPKPPVLCADFIDDGNHTLVRQSFDATKYTAGLSVHDVPHKDNPFMVASYATDFYQRLYATETKFQSRDDFMDDQDDINPKMRAILVDWIIEVHMKFRLRPETLYLCINIFDRYCSVARVKRRKVQLIGVSALFLASKYEDIYPPELRDMVYITDRAYTREEIINTETKILQALEYKLSAPTAHHFLTRYQHILEVSGIVAAASQFYLESTLLEYDALQHRPSHLAAAAICLAVANPDFQEEEDSTLSLPPRALLTYTCLETKQLIPLCAFVADCVCEDPNTSRVLESLERKFRKEQYHHVSSAAYGKPSVLDVM